MRSRQHVMAVILVTILTGSHAQAGSIPAAGTPETLPPKASGILASGKPAGVREAARRSPRPLLILGAATIVVAAVGIAVAQSNDTACGSACTSPTTTTN